MRRGRLGFAGLGLVAIACGHTVTLVSPTSDGGAGDDASVGADGGSSRNDGSTVEPGPDPTPPSGFATGQGPIVGLGLTSSLVAWMTSGGALRTCPRAGCTNGVPTDSRQLSAAPRSFVVGDDRGFWTDYQTVGITGAELTPNSPPIAFAGSGAAQKGVLAIDDQWIYGIADPDTTASRTLVRCPLPSIATTSCLATFGIGSQPIATVSGIHGTAFVGTQRGEINRVTLDSGTVESAVAPDLAGGLTTIVITSNNLLLWSSDYRQAVVRLSNAFATYTDLSQDYEFTTVPGVKAFAVDDAYLYWTSPDQELRATKIAGDPRTSVVFAGGVDVQFIVLDDDFVWFDDKNTGAIRRQAKLH
jgi:hypothetical protein